MERLIANFKLAAILSIFFLPLAASLRTPEPVRMRREKLVRKAAACIRLLAVALFYAPLAAATFAARGMDCCAGGFCPVSGHHHKRQKSAAPQDAVPTDCVHDMNGHRVAGMSECSMSCCQSPEHPISVPGAFVLPDATLLAGARGLVRPAQISAPEEISRLSKPLSPPPRSGASVL